MKYGNGRQGWVVGGVDEQGLEDRTEREGLGGRQT